MHSTNFHLPVLSVSGAELKTESLSQWWKRMNTVGLLLSKYNIFLRPCSYINGQFWSVRVFKKFRIYWPFRNLHYFKCFLPNLSILRKVSWTFYLFGEFINYFNLFCRFQHFYFLTSSEDKFIYVANFLCCFYLSLPRIICHNTEQVERSDLHHKKILNSR